MRRVLGVLAMIGCGSSSEAPDAPPPIDAAIDTPSCEPIALLTGTMDPVAQGWTVVMIPPATIIQGADYVELHTETAGAAKSGGQLLLSRAATVTRGEPFALQVELQLLAAAPHNQLDATAAILGSFTTPYGSTIDRREMIYLDADALGWADDTQRTPTNLVDGAYHTYVLSVDAAGAARLTLDGATVLTRTGYTTTGTIALGDQTNEAGRDSTMRIRSVTKRCVTP